MQPRGKFSEFCKKFVGQQVSDDNLEQKNRSFFFLFFLSKAILCHSPLNHTSYEI